MKNNSNFKVTTAPLYKASRLKMCNVSNSKVSNYYDTGEVKATRFSHYVAASAACKV